MPKGFTVLNVKMEFVKDDGPKHTSVNGAEHHLERVAVEDEELRRNKYEYCRRRIDSQFAKAREHLSVFGLIVVPQLVEVMNGDLAVSLKGTGEFRHDVGR